MCQGRDHSAILLRRVGRSMRRELLNEIRCRTSSTTPAPSVAEWDLRWHRYAPIYADALMLRARPRDRRTRQSGPTLLNGCAEINMLIKRSPFSQPITF